MNELVTELSMVMPVYNEAEIIEDIVRAYYQTVAVGISTEFVICEDGSTDRSQEILTRLNEELPIELVTGQERKGYARATKDALKETRSHLIFFSDSDGQYDPRDFWRLYRHIANCDMVIGRKINRIEPLYRILLSKGFHMCARLVFGVRLSDIDCGFRIIKRAVLERVLDNVKDLKYSFWAEFTIIASHCGFKIVEVPISHRDRTHGKTHIYSLSSVPLIVAKQLLDLIRLRLRLSGKIGRTLCQS